MQAFLKRTPAPRLARWMAYDAIEPIGGRRGDWQAAAMCAMVMNAAILMRTGKAKIHFQPKDFLLDWPDNTTKDTKEGTPAPAIAPWQHMKLIAQMHAALANAEAKPKRVWRK